MLGKKKKALPPHVDHSSFKGLFESECPECEREFKNYDKQKVIHNMLIHFKEKHPDIIKSQRLDSDAKIIKYMGGIEGGETRKVN